MIDLEKLWTEKLEGRAWQIKEEFLALLQLMIDENVKSVLEIGCYKGGTALGFLSIGCSVICIDKEPLPEGFRDLGDLYPMHFLQGIVGDTKRVDIIPSVEVDMLFIDGDHSYEYVKHDYEKFSPRVKKGGLIVFHDIAPGNTKRHGPECEVEKFWKELPKMDTDMWNFTIGDGNWGGIGVIRKI